MRLDIKSSKSTTTRIFNRRLCSDRNSPKLRTESRYTTSYRPSAICRVNSAITLDAPKSAHCNGTNLNDAIPTQNIQLAAINSRARPASTTFRTLNTVVSNSPSNISRIVRSILTRLMLESSLNERVTTMATLGLLLNSDFTHDSECTCSVVTEFLTLFPFLSDHTRSPHFLSPLQGIHIDPVTGARPTSRQRRHNTQKTPHMDPDVLRIGNPNRPLSSRSGPNWFHSATQDIMCTETQNKRAQHRSILFIATLVSHETPAQLIIPSLPLLGRADKFTTRR